MRVVDRTQQVFTEISADLLIALQTAVHTEQNGHRLAHGYPVNIGGVTFGCRRDDLPYLKGLGVGSLGIAVGNFVSVNVGKSGETDLLHPDEDPLVALQVQK